GTPTGATLGNDHTTINITNDEPLPTLSVSSSSQPEGDAGTTTQFLFTVSLSGPTSQTVTATYTTGNSSASTSDGDYVSATGSLTFQAGEISKVITVTVNGDSKYESNESFVVVLSNIVNAAAGATGSGTIVNDDPLPSLSIGDATIVEGNSGTATVAVTVSFS